MKLKSINTIRNKIWIFLIIFSFAILAFLWLFQVIFLSSYYEWVKTNEISKIAKKIKSSYENGETFQETLDSITYKEDVCIELIYKNSEIYSSNSYRGCIGHQSNDINYINYKRQIINGEKNEIFYKLTNKEFKNKIIIYGVKLSNDYYIIVNASLKPLGSTINILASQLVYVSILVFILSFVIAYYISKKISEPIISLNKTAKKMAEGNHNIKFEANTEIEELKSLAYTLNTANIELAKTDELRKELMANVSHDLKTPLTMIKAYSEMVRDLTYNDEEKRTDNLNTIIEETDRLNLLVNDMLELSKMQSNIIKLKIEKIDLNKLIKTVSHRFSNLDEYKIIYNGIKDAYINADKIKIEQVIYNLIGNATNYVGKDKQIIINLKEENDDYLVEVIDHGVGIDEKDLNLIWEKYYRVDKKHKRNTTGTGLGLSIVKNILIMHNFEYGVKSKKQKGTTFYFKAKKELK